jgi:hypothetical protein
VSGIENEVETLGQSDKDKEKITKKIPRTYARSPGHYKKNKPMSHGYKRRGTN